ncbi:CPBP family intramembrane glutamic endopeptidase [Marinifilum caeruleilacunae]|uniref:CPBP family intramembrane metalloprotease n=1 Tax=Marinifilum caeruleilacunae TaxID=2499076 RepID=A0ABX1X1V4_9BACT|nr:CPBP family intramembrane glutamic endopeptidase [Marinifilum caeruleilacunae]NOU62060.1 CPBP family intramembrane metalloprotease [Marinifilum caeruleilacunae]
MLRGSFSHYSSFSQLLLSLLLVLGSFMLTMFAGTLLALIIFDINIFTDTQSLDIHSDALNISVMKFYQSVYSIGMFIIPPFIFAFLVNKDILKSLFLDKAAKLPTALLATFIIIVSLPMINMLAQINSYLSLPEFMSGIETWMKNSEEQAKVVTEKFLVMNSVSDLLVNLVVIALIPAIGEELLFRGVLQGIFGKLTKNIHWGIIITAFLFAALHMQFYGLLPRMAMGILFGYLLIWSRSLWVPIIAHLANNGMAVITKYYIDKGEISKEMETIGANENYWFVGILSTVFVLLLLSFFRLICKRQA